LGHTVHGVLWADRRRREGEGAEARQLDDVELPSAEALSASEVVARRTMLDRFERAAAPVLAAFGEVAAHPWWGVTRSGLPAVDMEQAVRDTADTAASMASVAQAARALQSFGLPTETALGALEPPVQALAGLKVDADIPADWFAAFAAVDIRVMAAEWQQACRRYRASVEAQSKLVDLAAGTEPGEAAERLRAAWSPAARTVPVGMVVDDLLPWATDLHGKAALLLEMHRVAAETAAAVGLTATENLGEVAVAASALTLAAEPPQAVAVFVTPELMRSESADIVAFSAAAIRAARTRRAELDADYSIPPFVEPSILRQHAAALAVAGLFGFMSPAVKRAKLCFAGLHRAPRKVSRHAMAAVLVSVAEHLEAAAAIEVDQTARGAFGSVYLGITTDVDTALAAVVWAARVRSALPQSGGVAASACATLLSGDPDRLRSLRALASRPDHGTLQTYLAQFPPVTTSFADLATRLSGQARCIETVAATCRDFGVPAGTRAGDLPGTCDALQTTANAEIAARAPAALNTALQGTCPAPLDEHGPFDAALQLAFALDQLPLPLPLRSALWLTSPEALGSVIVPAAADTTDALGIARKRWASLKARLGLDEPKLLGRTVDTAMPDQVAARLSAAASQPGELGSWILYLREREAVEAIGLKNLLRLWDDRVLPCPLATAFDRVFHHALARAAFARHPELERFTGLGQQEARARFATLDAETAILRRQRLADELARQPVPIGIGSGKRSESTDRSLILFEIGKQKRHIPIRQLLDRAGAATQALKPCFMMSPLSVAQYLKPGGLRFDLLIIDEASQMRPEDAVGAVARCGQIVVVGDPKQLPPTAFFARSDATDDDDASVEEVDAESILDLAQTVFRPMRRLRWHYRSRHGSLVAFSNREFYDNDLMVFPSPAEADATQGVASVKVDGLYKARSNLAEVTAVCAAAAEHMRTRPDRSLGIATMNGIQRDLIALEMDRLAAAQPEVEAYRERWSETLERFFVKNLENVQGDERDVIFVSTVFGPPMPGGKVLQRFGPINGASGHRRLNVLFTRAKHHVRLFTSMTPDDVLAGPESPRGAQVLKAYLAYAQTGRLEAGVETGQEADSDFEVFVRDRLRIAGYEAVPQVGVAGFRIDLAVRNPRSPATFLLGIECDGASYHSSRSARDRDILRQQVLESLGWTIYRIWSTDWFRDPEGQTRKLLSFIAQEHAKTV
jgi:very-short-patch-repair endonuclease